MRCTSRWLVALAATVLMAASASAAGLVKTDTVVGKGKEAVPGTASAPLPTTVSVFASPCAPAEPAMSIVAASAANHDQFAFIQAELDSLARAGFTAVSLGPRVLRVETAVAALLGRLIR